MDKRKDRIKRPSSKKARKQRKFRFNAPNHTRRKMMSSRVDDSLRYPGGVYSIIPEIPRSLPVRKGDQVKVLRGKYKDPNAERKVARVNLRTMKIELEGLTYGKADDTQVPIPMDPSNVIITHLDMSDRLRQAAIKRAKDHKEKILGQESGTTSN